MSGGKSYLLRWGALAYSLYLFGKYHIKDVPIGLFSEDYPTLKDRQISRIKREFPEWLGQLKEDQFNGLSFKVADEYGGGIILLRNLDDPSKYMSTEFAGEFVEELTRNPQQTFEDLRNRLRYPGIDEVKFMGASNPGGIGHGWVKKLFIDKNSGDIEQNRFFYVHANAYDNKYISPEYIKQLESLPEQQKKAYLHGSWDVFAGQYFTEFRRDLHVIPAFLPNPENVIVGGMDWGRTAPFAFVLDEISIVNIEGTKFHRSKSFMEVYGTEKTPREWADIIKEKIKGFKLTLNDISWIQGDPAMFTKGQDNSISIADQFRREGIIIRPASNDRIGGWENLHNWLSLAPDEIPYWQITENCLNLILELPQLIHDETKIEDVDTSGVDHISDASRYQKKALKWINAKVGGYSHAKPKPRLQTAEFVNIDGEPRQMGIDLKKFANPNGFDPSKRVGPILRK